VKQSPLPQVTAKTQDPKLDNATQPGAGQEQVKAPSLVGISRQEAEKLILATGLHYQFFLEANDQAQGTVLKQDPLPQTIVPSGGNITFWVSKGK
jgi:beta-lactam-binding protein with PASTA domain